MPKRSDYSHILPGIMREGKPFNRATTFFDDFVGGFDLAAAEIGKWFVTDTGTNTRTVGNESNGTLVSVSDTADNDTANYQANGEAFQSVEGQRLIFEARLKSDDVSLNDFFVGLAITDTDILTSATDLIGFRLTDSTAGVIPEFVLEKDSTETVLSTGITLLDDTYNVFRFEIAGSGDQRRCQIFVDGNFINDIVLTNEPDDQTLTPSLQHRNASAAARTVTADYVLAVADRV